mgnify:FL=1
MDYESKTKYQRELMDQILKQLREFLKKKATVHIIINIERVLNYGTKQ